MNRSFLPLRSLFSITVGLILLFGSAFEGSASAQTKTARKKSTSAAKKQVSSAKTAKKQVSSAKKKAVPARKTATAKQATAKAAAARKAAPAKRRAAAPVRTAHFEPNTMAHFTRARIAGGPWNTPTYADSTFADFIDGEDLAVRQAAAEALGPLNGSVVVVDPNTGRILTMVNQQLALRGGYEPCSTIKVPVALAALSEGLVNRLTPVTLHGRTQMAMTEAMARSNNHYFAQLGVQLGFERFAYYARLFGYGEKAGLEIPGEQPGHFPFAAPRNGGVGMLTSFGEEIKQTPLQLAAFMAAVANGGTLYYLQHPRSEHEVRSFVPRIKRQLDIEPYIPEVMPGLLGAVMYGTARRAAAEQPIAGKTGTCTDDGARTRMGWFGSFNYVGNNQLVVAVMLTGGQEMTGSIASGVAGEVFRRLSGRHYVVSNAPLVPAGIVPAAAFLQN